MLGVVDPIQLHPECGPLWLPPVRRRQIARAPRQDRLLAVGCWLLVAGCWLLIVGCCMLGDLHLLRVCSLNFVWVTKCLGCLWRLGCLGVPEMLGVVDPIQLHPECGPLWLPPDRRRQIARAPRQDRLFAAGCWLLVAGSWLLIVGCCMLGGLHLLRVCSLKFVSGDSGNLDSIECPVVVKWLVCICMGTCTCSEFVR